MYSEDLTEDAKTAIQNKADKTGISYGILKKVYDRGVAAWKGGHRPGTTPQQWGMARINSFATGGKTRTTADADLWAKHKGKSESVNEQDEPASPDEASMAKSQLDFIEYAVKEISQHVAKGGDFPEWMQNKLSGVHDQVKSLHANIDHENVEPADEAVSAAQQAAIAISKKERGEKPKGEK